MHLASAAVSIFVAVARGELIAAQRSTADTIQPWIISALNTFSPSDCTGKCPNSSLAFTITDPNTIPAGQSETGEDIVFPPSTTHCSASWPTQWNIWDEIFNCSNIPDGQWVFLITKPDDTSASASPTENFDLSITLGDLVEVPGSALWKTFAGNVHIEAGVNLGGGCDDRGNCRWHLNEQRITVNQTIVECSGDDCDLTVDK